jgi:capsular polysaccharide biosynthesis protein
MYLTFQQFFESIELPKNFEIVPFQEGSRIYAGTAFFGDWAVSTFENEFSSIKDRMVVHKEIIKSFIHFISNISQMDKTKDDKLSKIFILRGDGSLRKIKGVLKLKVFCKIFGYVPYHPEKHTFYEQVKVFSRAGEIIIDAGSACANLIFCQKETKISIIIPGTIFNDKSVHEILLDSLDIKYKVLKLKPMRKKGPLEEKVLYQQTPGRFRTIDLLKILLMKIQ